MALDYTNLYPVQVGTTLIDKHEKKWKIIYKIKFNTSFQLIIQNEDKHPRKLHLKVDAVKGIIDAQNNNPCKLFNNGARVE